MSLVSYAESELDRIGMTDDGDMNGMMRKHLLHMVKEFADEGHSGFSASYALQCLKKLLHKLIKLLMNPSLILITFLSI